MFLEIVSGLVGLGALFGRRLKFSGQELPWYGFRRLPNGDIDVDPEFGVPAGLILLVAAFLFWVTLKSIF
jgi:hypothetical protein